MFTRQTIRHLANASSFQRGESYYDEGTLTKLRREGEFFLASVRGSRSYRVSLRLVAGELEFTCNCPYDFGGICKHEVALGLAVLDAYGTELTSAAPAAPAPSNELSKAVAAAWADRKKGDKLRFLKQALAKSDDLARQFLGFGRQPVAASTDDLLASLPTRLTETLEVLEFDEEFWENSESYYEDDEGDGLAEAVAEAVREALSPFVAELLALTRGGQLTAALRYWATASAAIYQVEEPASDDYGSFGDYGTEVLHQWHADLAAAGWPAGLLGAVLPPAELEAALQWTGQYLANPPAEWPDFAQSWQPLLLALAADPVAAPLLPARLAPARLSSEAQARLALQTARTLADDPAWAAAAETLLPTDADVAQQLLYFYHSRGDGPARLRTAEKAFATWPDRFGSFVLDTFTPETAPALYRAALRHRALANHSLPDAARLRPLLSAAETAGFVQAAVSRARASHQGVAFAAELLVQQADANALLEFVLGLEWLNVGRPDDLDRALALLAATNPLPLMLELETRLPTYLAGRANAKRGHALYERLASWLAVTRRAAPRLTEPVLRLAGELREEFRTLHGLRDALRHAGLLPPAEELPPPSAKKPKGRRGR